MPRYHFATHLGPDVIPDPEGVDLPDADAAWEAAQATIRAALRDPKAQGRLMAAILVVTDASGAVVLEFPFAEAVPLDTNPNRIVH